MGHTNYANYGRDETGNSSLMNTGATNDVVCNIYDMAANEHEWTTEYSASTGGSNVYPCVRRGGDYYYSNYYTAYRDSISATNKDSINSFRLTLYVKQH